MFYYFKKDSRSRHTTLGASLFFSCACLLLFGLVQVVYPQSVSADFEQPPIFQAASIIKPEVLKGEYYRIDDRVVNDGLFNHYTVKTWYGDFKVNSTPDLELLTHEINVIGELVKIETGDAMTQSLQNSAGNTVKGAKQLFTDPRGTMEGAGAGLNSLFTRAKGTIGKRELTSSEDSRTEQLIGISRSKGKIATRYGVNVYSRNQWLQDELDRLARADFLGGLSMTVVKSAIPGAGGLLLTSSETARLLNETINTTAASELWLQNKNKLLAMRFHTDTVELFLNNPVFSPAQQTVLVTALEKLAGVENRELFIKVALQASEVEMAQAITRVAVMSAGYHQNISPLQRFMPLARITCAAGKKGSVVVLLPTDYIVWSEKIADMANVLVEKQDKQPGSAKELWTLGSISKRTQSELKALGWTTHTAVGKQLGFKK